MKAVKVARGFRVVVAFLSVILAAQWAVSTAFLLTIGVGSAVEVFGGGVLSVLFYLVAVSQFAALRTVAAEPTTVVEPEPAGPHCPPHRWRRDEENRMRCTFCKQRPLE